MNYFKQILFTFLLFFVCSIEAVDQSANVDIRAQGRGETKEEAILNAKVRALQSFAEFFSVREELVNDQLSQKIVALSVGAVSEFEVISSYINVHDQIVVEIKAKLNRDSMQLVDLFPIDPDKASMNVNGSFYATESAKWRFNQKNEIEAIKHLLEKIQIIGETEGFVQAMFPRYPTPRRVRKSLLQNKFDVDYYASENMNTVFEVVRTTIRSLSVSRTEYMTISNREIFQVELCTDAMLFGDRFEKQKKRGNKIPDCEYETYYLRNKESLERLQEIEDYVRSDIKSTKVVRQHSDGTCKNVLHAKFDEKEHSSIKRIYTQWKPEACFNEYYIKILDTRPLGKESYYWPQILNSNDLNEDYFSNNLTFNTCNVDYRKKERIFFPVTRSCRAIKGNCVIPYRNGFGNKENAAFGLNLPLGGELIARKTIIDTLREVDISVMDGYKAKKNSDCN